MHSKTLSVLLLSGLIAGAAISSADAASMGGAPVQPQYQANDMTSWMAANGSMAIRQQSGENQHHHHGDGARDGNAHDSSASSSSADSSSSHSGSSHGGGGRH
ncbi:hypothetical protein G3545_07835 [Starkeya sp. ORNL1]|uniref:hypothetical protein n=1 Tax=Starkeya sp. ORNL1 TaxID=2709380 RepID=UPI001463F55B|nr:hypothetical protein [Starkeya sp. ORNL1]QJP13573.1 hypothetical protein G3545_07835 [Starkeya sp. ORNL1]